MMAYAEVMRNVLFYVGICEVMPNVLFYVGICRGYAYCFILLVYAEVMRSVL